MKCSDKKYIMIGSEDQSRYSFDFSNFVNVPTKTDYTLISIGSGTRIYDIYDNMVLFWTELPNCLLFFKDEGSDYNKTFEKQDKFIKILTDCPFSVEYFNEKNGYNKFQHVFFPIDSKYIPEQSNKLFDVFYTGHYFNSPIKFSFPMLEQKFNFCFVGHDYGNHRGCSYKEKLSLNSKSKISIVHGLLEWKDPSVFSNFKGHKSFSLVKELGIVPQFKTRTLEAAMSKSLILSFHDPWNMIESYFEKDEFIYWYNLDDLEEKINHIISNYDQYSPMIGKAYEKVMSYTKEIFFNKFLRMI